MKWPFFVIFFTTLVQSAFSQVAPPGIGIIPNSSQPADLNSGRYQVKPKTVKKERPHAEEYQRAQQPPKKLETPAVEPVVHKIEKPEEASTLNVQTDQPVVPTDSDPGLFQRARDLVIGGSPKDLNEYRSYLPPDDTRRNLIDLYIAPIFIYNDSSSPYWFRSYSSFSPGFTSTANLWFTPLFGFEATYRKSITGAIRNSPSDSSYVSASHEWLNAGFRFRRFFGYGENIPMLVIGIDYREYNFRVPTDDENRIRTKTVGPRLTIDTLVPSSPRYAWRYSLEATPFAKHYEIGTGYDLQSGTENETFGFGLGVGGEYKLDRTSRLFFKLSYFLEKNLFSGSANRADPNNGLTPSSVPVTNSFTVFELGYIWGQ